MSSLFIELYLDEDVSAFVATLLRARGFGVVTTSDAGKRGAADAEQLAYAAIHNKAILTHNRLDFERLAQSYFDAGQSHAGIVIAKRRLPQELVHRLLAILNQVTADEMMNQIRYI